MFGTNNCLRKNKNNKDIVKREDKNRKMPKKYWIGGSTFLSVAAAYVWFWLETKSFDFKAISNEIFAIGLLAISFIAAAIALTDAIIGINASLKNLISRVSHLAQRVGDIDGKQEMKMNSPISLTKKGQELLDAADGKRLAEKYHSKIKLSTSASNYEVQETCLAFAEFDFLDKLESQEKTELENLAYQRGISIERVLRVIGIEMRDLILAERKKSETSADA